MAIRRVLALMAAAAVSLTAAVGCSGDAEAEKRRHVERADAFATEQRYAEAVIEYRNALQWDERDGEVRLRLSRVYMQIDDVVNAYREAVRAADLLPEDAAAQIHAANFLLMAGQHEDARTRAEKLLAREPSNVEAQLLVGYATAGMRDFDAAIAQIEEAIGLTSDRADTHTNLGMIHLVKGDHARAEAALKKALAIDSQSVSVHLALANFYWTTSRLDEAERVLRTAIGLDDDDARPRRALAALYRATNRAADAEPLLLTVVERSDDVAPRLALADYYMSMDRAADALALLESLPGDAASRPDVRSRVATAQHALGRDADAYRTVDALVAAEPRNVEAMVTRARLLLADDEPAKARLQADAAVQADPKSVAARYTLGLALVLTGDRQAAIREFNEVLALNPRAADAQVQLSRLRLEERQVGDSVNLAG